MSVSQPLPVTDILLEANNALSESRTNDAVALLNEAIFQLHQRMRTVEKAVVSASAPAAQPRRLSRVCMIPGCGCNGEEHA